MIRIAIVDDEREILELLFRIIDDTLKREQAQFEITTFLKAEELLSSHREKPFQIIFADLEMPDVDGLHLAEELRKEDQHTLLIFVTNHDELVFQCFQYEVFNFIRKDFLESELPLAAASAYQKVWNHTSKLQLKSKTGLLSLAADDVVYFVSENHTIMMCEKENTKVQVMYTMEKLEKLLPQNQFGPLSCRLYRQLFLCVFHQSKRDLADDRRTDSFEPTPEKRDEVCFSAVFKGYMKWSYFIRRVKWQQQALKWS